MAIQTLLAKPGVRDYSHIKPLPDPPRQPDMMKQYPGIHAFTSALGLRFKDREDVYVGALGYLWADFNDTDGPYPDGSFAKGLADPNVVYHRNGYVISEVGKPPDLVYEVGSESTGRHDYTTKRDRYAGYGIREYWRFDPSGGEFHDAPLAGDTLVDGRYEPIEIVSEPDGRHWGYSEVLGLEFWWEDGELRFRDPVSGEFLPTLNESEEARQSAERRARSEYDARQSAERRARSEQAARQSAERRARSEYDARQSAERRARSEYDARQSAERRVAELEAELRRRRGE